jgi:hypothetical protein
MIINIICAECGEKMVQGFAEMEDGELNLTALNHECKPTQKNVTLAEAIMAVENGMVELGYFKKDGSFVTMRGRFSPGIDSKIGYQFFMKCIPGGEAHPRNLLRRGITSVYDELSEMTYIIR